MGAQTLNKKMLKNVWKILKEDLHKLNLACFSSSVKAASVIAAEITSPGSVC